MKFNKNVLYTLSALVICSTLISYAGIGTTISNSGIIQNSNNINKSSGTISKGIGTNNTSSSGEIVENEVTQEKGNITYGMGYGKAVLTTCKTKYEAVAPSIGSLSADSVVDAISQSPEAWNQNWKVWDHVGYKDKAFNGERHVVKRKKGVQFLGYAIPGFNDMMLKDFGEYNNRVISVIQSPVRSDWHTINGSGIVFNADMTEDTFQGNAIVATENDIELRIYPRTSKEVFMNGDAPYTVIFTAPKVCPGQAFTVEMKNENKTDMWTDFKIYDRETLVYEGGDTTYGTYAGLMTDYKAHNCTSLSSSYIPNFMVDGVDYLKENSDI